MFEAINMAPHVRHDSRAIQLMVPATIRNLPTHFYNRQKMLWIWIQNGSAFSKFVDPDPHSEYGSKQKGEEKNTINKIHYPNLDPS